MMELMLKLEMHLGTGHEMESVRTHLTRLCEGVINIEQQHGVFEGALLKRRVDGCCGSHCDV